MHLYKVVYITKEGSYSGSCIAINVEVESLQDMFESIKWVEQDHIVISIMLIQ